MPRIVLSRQWSRREREIMAILYRRGRVTARDVWSALDGGPDYATVPSANPRESPTHAATHANLEGF